MKCSQYLHGPRIPCTGILLEGAAVIPGCKPQYHKNFNHDYRHVICQKDGTWNKEFFQCSPSNIFIIHIELWKYLYIMIADNRLYFIDCGRTPSSIVNLIVNGRNETRGEAPWNVAVYSSENSKVPDFICGGTLISAELVVSGNSNSYLTSPWPWRTLMYLRGRWRLTFFCRSQKKNNNNSMEKYKRKKTCGLI